MSKRLQGLKTGTLGSAVGFSNIWPFGLVIGVPDMTTDDARPW